MFNFHLLTTLDRHIRRLESFSEGPFFLVWWAVRDALFSIETKDIDATGAFSPEALWETIEKKNSAIEMHGLFRTEKYGTVTIIYNEKWKSEGIEGELIANSLEEAHNGDPSQITYEITPFREEWWYDDLRHPSEIKWSHSLTQDAGRRDFTINALYYTIQGSPVAPSHKIKIKIKEDQLVEYLQKNGWTFLPSLSLLVLQDANIIERFFVDWKYNIDTAKDFFASQKAFWIDPENIRILLDPTNGLQDVYAQKLRTVGEPDKRFNEDALRILRALRFVNIRNQQIPSAHFDFQRDTWDSIKTNYALVQHLPKERIHQELLKVFSANNPFGYVALLDETNLLQYIFPALYQTKNNEQPVRYHPFDTYAHTLLTLLHLQQINTNYLVKLGMLYHDVGKPQQYAAYTQAMTKEERNAIHASELNHTNSGPVFVKKDMSAVWFSNKEIEEIARYVAQHMRPWQILEATGSNQIKKLRTLYAEVWYELTKNIIDICKADRLGQYNPLQGNEVDSVDTLYALLDELRAKEGQFTKDQLAVSWNDIMEYFGISPWPEIGKMLSKAFDRVLHEREKRNSKEAILLYLEGIRNYAK